MPLVNDQIKIIHTINISEDLCSSYSKVSMKLSSNEPIECLDGLPLRLLAVSVVS